MIDTNSKMFRMDVEDLRRDGLGRDEAKRVVFRRQMIMELEGLSISGHTEVLSVDDKVSRLAELIQQAMNEGVL